MAFKKIIFVFVIFCFSAGTFANPNNGGNNTSDDEHQSHNLLGLTAEGKTVYPWYSLGDVGFDKHGDWLWTPRLCAVLDVDYTPPVRNTASACSIL